MSTTLTMSETAANAMLDAAHVDGGGTHLVFLTAADAIVAAVELMAPAWSAASSGETTMLLNGGEPLSDDNTAAGTITKARLQDAATVGETETVWWEGDVGTSDAVFVMPQTTFAAGERLEVKSLAVTIAYEETL